MPVLKCAKHERMAQEIAKGKTYTEAYVIAGYKDNDANASKLARKVQGRVREITGEAAKKTGVTVERVLSELALLGFSNMQDYITVGQDGLPFCDFTSLDRKKAAAIQEVTVETRHEVGTDEDGKKEAIPVRKVKFRLVDKRAALVDLGKHLGMFVEKHEHGVSAEIGDRLSAAIKRLSQG